MNIFANKFCCSYFEYIYIFFTPKVRHWQFLPSWLWLVVIFVLCLWKVFKIQGKNIYHFGGCSESHTLELRAATFRPYTEGCFKIVLLLGNYFFSSVSTPQCNVLQMIFWIKMTIKFFLMGHLALKIKLNKNKNETPNLKNQHWKIFLPGQQWKCHVELRMHRLGSSAGFSPKLLLTTAYQPLISATFSLCDFYWCVVREAGLSLHLTGVQIVLENSANISLHYPPPPPPPLCFFSLLVSFSLPFSSVGKVKSRPIGIRLSISVFAGLCNRKRQAAGWALRQQIAVWKREVAVGMCVGGSPVAWR